jgi:hypothetical protein
MARLKGPALSAEVSSIAASPSEAWDVAMQVSVNFSNIPVQQLLQVPQYSSATGGSEE